VCRSADERRYAVPRARVRLTAVRGAGCVAVGLAAALAIGACGQPTPTDDEVGPTVSVEVQPTIAPETPTVDTPDTTAPVAGGLFDASTSLVASTCAPTGDVWNFAGTVQNADTVAHTFTVAVFIVSPSAASDVAGKEIDVTVGPGEKGDVAAKAFWRGPASGVECLTGVTVKEE
jgi:hypothetical protein